MQKKKKKMKFSKKNPEFFFFFLQNHEMAGIFTNWGTKQNHEIAGITNCEITKCGESHVYLSDAAKYLFDI